MSFLHANGPTPMEGTASGGGGNSSFGWYQVITTIPASNYVSIDADWTGNIGGAGWAEVMFFSVVPGTSNADIELRIDTGNAADIAFRKDSWGMNPPTSWGWQDASLSLHPAGNGGVIHSVGWMVVGLKLGGFPVGTASWDNITVLFDNGDNGSQIPEPTTMLLLGSGLLSLWGARKKFKK